MKDGRKTYQVWHIKDEVYYDRTERCAEAQFPRDYAHVANARANSLEETVHISSNVNHDLMAPRPYLDDWTDLHRDTNTGDVIVDPSGRPYRVAYDHFKEIAAQNQYNPQPDPGRPAPEKDKQLRLSPINRPVAGKEARDLAAETHQDEHAARVRDYGNADAATYEEQVREDGRMTVDELDKYFEKLPNPASQEIASMLADVAVPKTFEAGESSYERRIAETAELATHRTKEKDRGPVR